MLSEIRELNARRVRYHSKYGERKIKLMNLDYEWAWRESSTYDLAGLVHGAEGI